MRRQLRVVQHPRLQLAGAASSQHSRDAPPDSVRGPGGRTLSGQWPLQRSPSVAGCPQSASPRSAKHRQTPAYLLRRLPAGTRKNLVPSPRCLSGFCRLAVAGERCLGAARIFGAPLSSPQPALRSLPASQWPRSAHRPGALPYLVGARSSAYSRQCGRAALSGRKCRGVTRSVPSCAASPPSCPCALPMDG